MCYLLPIGPQGLIQSGVAISKWTCLQKGTARMLDESVSAHESTFNFCEVCEDAPSVSRTVRGRSGSIK